MLIETLFGVMQNDDSAWLGGLLTVESALARAEAKVGVIPATAAEAITAAITTFAVDRERLRTGIAHDGVPIPELVRQLREHIGGEAASFVHWGATTQDIMDTALVLNLRTQLDMLDAALLTLTTNLAGLADKHRRTLMAGRTHSQQALPIPFGYKVAGWIAPLLRDRERLAQLRPRLEVVQFGGAVGTLAALGAHGMAVQSALAAELGLGVALLPWHTARDSFVELGGWLSLVMGSLAKMATDIILMAQSEVGEVRESDDPARGGSSTMPQKSNPIVSDLIIAAARTSTGLLGSLHGALIAEHERATGGWQVEWLTLPQMVSLCSGALDHAVFLSENLTVDAEQMRANVAASHGLMLAEPLSFALTPALGRTEAQKLLKKAVAQSIAEKRHLVDVVREMTDTPLDWEMLRNESNYFGAAETFIDRVLTEIRLID